MSRPLCLAGIVSLIALSALRSPAFAGCDSEVPPNGFVPHFDAECSPYTLLGDLVVDNATVVVDPGVILEFAADSASIVLRNSSSLEFRGTEDAPIVLRGQLNEVDSTRVRWRGIRLEYPTPDAATDANGHEFEWVRFENATFAYDIEYFEAGSSVSFRHCTVVGGDPGTTGGLRIGSAASDSDCSVMLHDMSVHGIENGVGIDAFSAVRDMFFVEECDVSLSETGFRLEGFVEARDLLAEGCEYGMSVHLAPTVERCILRDNSNVGLRIDQTSGPGEPVFSRMQVLRNGVGVRVKQEGDCHFNDSHLLDNTTFAVEIERECPGGDQIDFERCWWGPEATQEMNMGKNVQAIWDGRDDTSLCLVDYAGFLPGPVVDAPFLDVAARGLLVAPNPFRTSARISYELAREAEVTVAVYDVTGRLVRVLQHGHRAAGPHTTRWDGRTEGGVPTGTGVYFLRMTGPGRQETKRVTLLR